MNASAPNAEIISDRCKETVVVATDAIAWFTDAANRETVGHERKALEREFRSFKLNARKLETAVNRPMCVGVFGPSQAGKSYLVSVLARHGHAPLMALFGDEEIDFISKINPEGNKESTGLVTRFTVQPVPHPPGFPVCLRLLSQSDVVRILANSFFFDSTLKDEPIVTGEEIRSRLEAAKKMAREKKVDALTEEDVWEIQEYFEKQFEGIEHMKVLTGFWDEAAELAPRLDLVDRAELFSILWGGHQKFTDLYKLLVGALRQLGSAADAFCGLDALMPRQNSIIDVATLSGLGSPGGEVLDIKPADGPVVKLPRTVITALVAELRIVMKDKPWPFFEHTDLLDFPGARSRQRKNMTMFLEDMSDSLKETFLRGKVAYLFDRYVAEQELTSMLLCIRPSNQEVTTLPDMLDEWISKTHGATPAERAGKPIVLFFVMTMFDTHFDDPAGADPGDPGNRFRARLHASLLGFFGQAHEWPRKWTPREPFRNCFWLRNPNFPAKSIIRYDGRREVEFLPEELPRIARLKTGYLGVEEVRAHFADPERAWEEALKLNDGGVSYLAGALAPVCNPEMKRVQVLARLNTLRSSMKERLSRFYVSDDIDARLSERMAAADEILDQLYQAADLGRFGHLLDFLQVTSAELTDVLYRVDTQLDDETVVVAGPQRQPGARVRPDPLAGHRPRPATRGAGPASAPMPKIVTREQRLAEAAIKHWLETLSQVAGSARVSRTLHMGQGALAELVAELKGGARRLELDKKLADKIKHFSYIEKGDQSIAKPALLASTTINRFVATLGYGELPADRRPRVTGPGGDRPVFSERQIRHDASDLLEEPRPYTNDYLDDWVFALVDLIRQNAASKDGLQVDVAQNARIGSMLNRLEEVA